MKVVRWMTAVAAAAFVASVQAPDRALGAAGDPEVVIYRFSGVLDDGSGFDAGVATAFHCTNFSGATETVRIVVRGNSAVMAANAATDVAHLNTQTFATHPAHLYAEFALNTGIVIQGTAAIAATSTAVVCTAMTIDAASSSPVGIALHGMRFSPLPGTQE